jgi:hypothetical protein
MALPSAPRMPQCCPLGQQLSPQMGAPVPAQALQVLLPALRQVDPSGQQAVPHAAPAQMQLPDPSQLNPGGQQFPLQ